MRLTLVAFGLELDITLGPTEPDDAADADESGPVPGVVDTLSADLTHQDRRTTGFPLVGEVPEHYADD